MYTICCIILYSTSYIRFSSILMLAIIFLALLAIFSTYNFNKKHLSNQTLINHKDKSLAIIIKINRTLQF